VVTRANVTLRRWLRSSVIISKDHLEYVRQHRIRVLLGHRVFVTFRGRDGARFVPQGFIPWRADALLESLTRNGWRVSKDATPDQMN
jgi:hypothetical protein